MNIENVTQKETLDKNIEITTNNQEDTSLKIPSGKIYLRFSTEEERDKFFDIQDNKKNSKKTINVKFDNVPRIKNTNKTLVRNYFYNNSDKILRVAAYCRVSTDSKEQKSSYDSQRTHYDELIKGTPNWEFVDVYADEGITGTQMKKRDNFIRMMGDAVSGKIDMIIAKSISRFARNTVDTLNCIRLLREYNIDVYFEEQNIHTLSMNNELFLTLYSAFAQAESESISENMKAGLKFKMERGEMVGQYKCYGYDYNKETKVFSINLKQAEIVIRIFEEYARGVGTRTICRDLQKDGILSPKGNKTWQPETIRRIIKNEKYCGDLITGKSFIADVLNHKAKINKGEVPQFYTENHHMPIVLKELWNAANNVLKIRSSEHKDKVDKYSRRYAFSSKIYCGVCGERFIRKSYVKNKANPKSPRVICWGCRSHFNDLPCDNRINYKDEELKNMFVVVFNNLFNNFQHYSDLFLNKIESILNDNNDLKLKSKLQKEQAKLKEKQAKLLDLMLDNMISKDVLNEKMNSISIDLSDIETKLNNMENIDVIKREKLEQLEKIKNIVMNTKNIDKFDDELFNSIVDRIIIGQKNEDGSIDYKVVKFILKTGTVVNAGISVDNFLKDLQKNTNAYSTVSVNLEQKKEISYNNLTAYVQHERGNVCWWKIQG